MRQWQWQWQWQGITETETAASAAENNHSGIGSSRVIDKRIDGSGGIITTSGRSAIQIDSGRSVSASAAAAIITTAAGVSSNKYRAAAACVNGSTNRERAGLLC